MIRGIRGRSGIGALETRLTPSLPEAILRMRNISSASFLNFFYFKTVRVNNAEALVVSIQTAIALAVAYL